MKGWEEENGIFLWDFFLMMIIIFFQFFLTGQELFRYKLQIWIKDDGREYTKDFPD
jgi:hypothetical protein